MSDHPVLAAIRAERERLELVVEGLTGELDQANAELAALEQAEAGLGPVLNGDATPELPAAPPPKPKPALPASPAPKVSDEQILAFVAERGGTITASQLRQAHDLPREFTGRRLKALVTAGKLTRTGKAAGTRYHSGDGSAPKPPKPTNGKRLTRERERAVATQRPEATPAGRILNHLMTQGPRSLDELATMLGLSGEVVKLAVSQLYRESEVKPKRENGVIRYCFAGAIA